MHSIQRALDRESRVLVLNPQPATQPRQPHAESLALPIFTFLIVKMG